jgi:hypothetical protein
MTNAPPVIAKPSSKDPAKELLSAAQICWLYALLPGIPIAIIFAFGDFNRLGSTGTRIVYCALAYSVLLLLSGTLLYNRSRVGYYLSAVLMVIMVIQIPIGTIAGLLLASKLNNPHVKALLK